MVYSLDIPVLYKCSGVLVEQQDGGKTVRRAVATKSLYLKLDRNQVSVYGTQNNRSICKKFNVRKIIGDTLFIDTGMRDYQNDVKIYALKDTLYGNYNFLSNSMTDTICVKVPVVKLNSGFEARLQKECR